MHFCSYVQMRGSIPTYWYQETSVTMPKPPILINRVDPDYLATEEHFVDLMQRYGAPIIVLDLVKHHEKRPRESLVGKEFQQAVAVLNESIPASHKIIHIALDYSKITSISKGKGAGKGTNKASASSAMAVAGSEWALMASSLDRPNVAATSNAIAADDDSAKERQVGSPFVGVARGGGDMPSSHEQQLRQQNMHMTDSYSAAAGNTTAAAAAADVFPATTTATTAPGTIPAGSSSGGPSIDVLKELENIANLTIHETGFFCK